MLKLIVPAILAVVLVVGYQQYSNHQQQERHAAMLKNYAIEKQALEKARETKSPQPLDQFLQQYPDSAWVDTAIYYRDKFAIQEIIQSRNTRKLKAFIENNPGSEWLASAQQHLKRIQRERENKEIQQQILQRQSNLPLAEPQPEAESTAQSQPPAEVTKIQPTRSATRPDRNDSAERVKRALSIYQTMNKPKIAREEKRKEQQRREERHLRACNSLKDQLQQFNNSRRTRWYDLDDSGNRVYMNKHEVALRKKEIRSKIEENCS